VVVPISCMIMQLFLSFLREAKRSSKMIPPLGKGLVPSALRGPMARKIYFSPSYSLSRFNQFPSWIRLTSSSQGPLGRCCLFLFSCRVKFFSRGYSSLPPVRRAFFSVGSFFLELRAWSAFSSLPRPVEMSCNFPSVTLAKFFSHSRPFFPSIERVINLVRF